MLVKTLKKPLFTVTARDKKSHARTGILRTAHGIIRTPAYVMVATRGYIKTLIPSDIKKTKTQLVIANAYHLGDEVRIKPPKASLARLDSPQRSRAKGGNDELRVGQTHNLKLESFLLQKLKRRIPTMTDSGGFQVFSFGAARESGVGKVLMQRRRKKGESNAVNIIERGARITLNGKSKLLTPEESIWIQEKIGADIIFVFDECTSPLHSFAYNKAAMERTHRWAQRCLDAHTRKDQMLMGIVQGGRFASLRKASAKIIGAMPFDGFGIGGSFGKNEMVKTLGTVIPHLPDAKPRHLLGIGALEDILNAIAAGVDMFDCVIPTREGRHGRIWTDKGSINILKAQHAGSSGRLAPRCTCPACSAGTTRGKLRALFKSKDACGKRLATLHNVWFFNTFLERVRDSITKGTFVQFRKRFSSRTLKP